MSTKPKAMRLEKLIELDRNAGTVWLALQALGLLNVRRLSLTRERVVRICHLSEKRVSSALGALVEAGWITKKIAKKGARRWLIVCPLVSKTPDSNWKMLKSRRAENALPPDENEDVKRPSPESQEGRKTTYYQGSGGRSENDLPRLPPNGVRGGSVGDSSNSPGLGPQGSPGSATPRSCEEKLKNKIKSALDAGQNPFDETHPADWDEVEGLLGENRFKRPW